MKGQYFIEIVDGVLTAQGLLQENVGRGFFRVRFFGNPAVNRVLPAEAVQNFLIFDSQADVEAWLKERTPAQADPVPDPVPDPEPEAPEED